MACSLLLEVVCHLAGPVEGLMKRYQTCLRHHKTQSVAVQDADLYAQMNQSMADVAHIQPLTDAIEDVLRVFYNFDTPKV